MDPRPSDPRAPFGQTTGGADQPDPATAGEGAGNGKHPATAAFHRLANDVGALRDYLTYYLTARADAIKAKVRRIGILAGLGAVGAIAGAALVVTAVVLLLLGLAGGVSRLVNTGPWLGQLIIGAIILGMVGAGAMLFLRATARKSLKKAIRRYEQKQRIQRQRFGADVRQRASAARN